MDKRHAYAVSVEWTGNTGVGTANTRAYARDHDIKIAGKPTLAGSSDPGFRGDPSRHNPEDLLVASLSACHMLWYLGIAAAAGVVVIGYVDHAEGVMVEEPNGSGRFVSVTLRPEVTLAPGGDAGRAQSLHAEAHAKCFIANSVNFPVDHAPITRVAT